MTEAVATKKSLEERLAQGVVICAEGYLFELEKRGYVAVGPFVPEVVLQHPEAVEQLHREFLRAGSDIVEAFTYYGHREKMRLVGKEHLLEPLNRNAVRLAKKVAAEGNALVAGNICNTNVFDPTDEEANKQVRAMMEEQVLWAKEEGVDLVIAETFMFLGEALIATEVIKAAGLPSVITLAVAGSGVRDCPSIVEAGLKLKAAGATVVGVNCSRGPATMLPLLKELVAGVPGPIAALPVPYRTTSEKPTFQSLCSHTDKMYMELEPHTCTRFEMAEFAKEAVELGVKYIGVCCGGSPYHVRAMAEAIGRTPPASEFSPNLALHFTFGKHESFKPIYTSFKQDM
eukprot:TRINITY_DN1335_c0_g1_i1.p1 TRINITY_DN1335_c0_g1~~TRINITY_DN1335_c0_g1_i1.p1  ORF type:complete len:344 (-),score=61.80 TRINITY_DN1335_c0_g1_i1:21-1052(-)